MAFTGTLNQNLIFGALYNQIISQHVFADNIKGTYGSLAEKCRVDGSLYGDTKLYYSTDALSSSEWGNDAEAANLLALHRPNAPLVQAITIDQFRQIKVTVDNYLTKQAFADENSFAQFNSVVLGWIRDTKRIYDSTLINSYFGTTETAIGSQSIEITLPTASDPEAQARLQAQTIAADQANLLVEMQDVTRDYNDNGFIRSYTPEDLMIIWNSEVYNEITKLDLPTIYHDDGLYSKVDKVVLPARFFGTVNATSGTTGANNTTVRSLIETTYGDVHVFPGDLIPNSTAYAANDTYTVDSSILFKIVHKRSVPFMSGFEVGTSFFNPASLTSTNYLTFGYNSLEYLKNYPFVTVRKA